MDVMTFLTIWGAIVATVAITWNIIRDLGDRGKLKIEALIGNIILGPLVPANPPSPDKDYLVITITNVGRRPILVINLGGMRKRDGKDVEFLILPRGLPRMLSEGEYHIEYTADLSILTSALRKIYVLDSTGKKWGISKKNLKRLLLESKEQKKEQKKEQNDQVDAISTSKDKGGIK